jgi:hypothetical protein
MREKVKKVMRYAGSHTLVYHPVLSMHHVFDGRKKLGKHANLTKALYAMHCFFETARTIRLLPRNIIAKYSEYQKMVDIMTKKLANAAFLLVVLFLTTSIANLAQALVPGVTQGNEFTYDIMGLWSSPSTNVEIPAYLLEFNKTDYYKVIATEVSGADVSVHTVWRFANGTEIEGDSEINLETGIYTGGFWAIFAADLGANDRVRPQGYDQSTVNETITRDYLGGERETNHLMLTLQQYDSSDPTHTSLYTEKSDIYFDKQTGMLVELRDDDFYSNPSRTVTIIWKIRDSNVWNVPEFPIILIPTLFMIATLLIVIAYKKYPNFAKALIPTKLKKF